MYIYFYIITYSNTSRGQILKSFPKWVEPRKIWPPPDWLVCRRQVSEKKFFDSFCLKKVKTNQNIFHAPLLPSLRAFLFCISPHHTHTHTHHCTLFCRNQFNVESTRNTVWLGDVRTYIHHTFSPLSLDRL